MNKLFNVLGIDISVKGQLASFSKQVGISASVLEHYNKNNILPSSSDLDKISKHLGLTALEIQLAMAIVDSRVLDYISLNYKSISNKIDLPIQKQSINFEEAFSTNLGSLYKGDCISYLNTIDGESFDLIFADPPFNLNKFYLSEIDDNRSASDYLDWCETWLAECVRVLKPGGSLFLWNLPKWNSYFASFLNSRLTFRHWIATDIKYTLPIHGKLYPSHYSLLYYIKGDKPKSFHPDRLPMEICKNCFKEIKDYGGYKNKMNSKGINLSDVWTDIPPVRHRKYKKRQEANELSIKLLDRIIEMATEPGDTIFDPFGGSGTTYLVSEIKNRNWKGIELGPVDSIIKRFENIDEEVELLTGYRQEYNVLFTQQVKEKRKQRNLWTDDTFNNISKPLLINFNLNEEFESEHGFRKTQGS